MTIPIICGSTSSGKTEYALNLAKKYDHANILSADSRQFYQAIPIVSGQDTSTPKVSIYGQGILSPAETSNISDYKKYVLPIITKSVNEGTPLIIVGGSGLYLKAITENLNNTEVPPDQDFRLSAEKMTVSQLQEQLKIVNSKLFDSLNNSDRNNPRRLIRHLEINNFYKHNPQSTIHDLSSTIQYQWIGLQKPASQLAKDIRSRVISRLENGAVEEIKKLTKSYPNKKLPIYSTLGVSFIVDFIENKIDERKLIDLWTQSEISYSKRQMVWFRKQPGIIWYDSSKHDQIQTP